MTDLEKRAIINLVDAKMPRETWHGRRVRELFLKLEADPFALLSFEEQADLWYLTWRYRRQVRDLNVVAHADEVVNGALALRF